MMDRRRRFIVRQRIFIALAVTALCSLSPLTAHAATAGASQSTFQQLYDKADAAAKRKDADGVIGNYSTTVEAVQKDGTTKTYADLLSAAQQMFMLATGISSHTSIASCTIKGNLATVVQNGATKITVADPNGGPATMVIEDDSQARDEWKKTDSGWKIVREVIISDDMKANGKPVSSLLGGQTVPGE